MKIKDKKQRSKTAIKKSLLVGNKDSKWKWKTKIGNIDQERTTTWNDSIP